MLEKNLNHDLIQLFNNHGWAHKLPDPPAAAAYNSSPRPFDGIACFKEFDFFFESKLIKNKISAFPMSRIEAHQFYNLIKLRELGKVTGIILGLWIARKTYIFLVFDTYFLYNLKSKSILKKELEAFIAEGYAVDLRHPEDFKPAQLRERMIYDYLPGRDGGKIHK
jgi:penicillin-binding protein-related factor A (putative recombinase)